MEEQRLEMPRSTATRVLAATAAPASPHDHPAALLSLPPPAHKKKTNGSSSTFPTRHAPLTIRNRCFCPRRNSEGRCKAESAAASSWCHCRCWLCYCRSRLGSPPGEKGPRRRRRIQTQRPPPTRVAKGPLMCPSPSPSRCPSRPRW